MVFVLVLLLSTVAMFAEGEGKRINLFADLGAAANDFEGMFIDVGVEMQLSGKFYGQLLFDYYLDPTGSNTSSVKSEVYGFGLYGVYKAPLSDNLNFFVKGGLTYQMVKVSVEFLGVTLEGETESELGFGAGGGIEYGLSEKLALQAGLTYRGIFAEGGANWLKIYGGVSFRIK